MKVFISWSGERSKQMAAALKEWLPTAIQYLEPWMSDTDIHAGDRWADKMATELKESNVGIVCVTGENLTSEWLHFEAGALSKLMQNTRVITVLLDLDEQAVSGPLTLFQMKKLDKGGVLDIAISLNKFAEHKLDEATLNNAVNGMWTSLEQKIKAIPAADKTTIIVIGKYFINWPTIPGQTKRGKKTIKVVTVEAIIGQDILTAPSK